MMAKRIAGSELNDRNWDDEEEPEEAGVFTQAAKDILEQRAIKKAKRRVVDDNSGSKTSAFSGFSGLGVKTPSLNTDTFSGFKKLDGNSSMPSISAGTSSINGSEDQKSKSVGDTKDSSVYLSSLKSLNESVLAWIKQHVERNPYIILTPIFRDYEKYLELIQAGKSSASGASSSKEDRGDNQNANSAASVSAKVTGALSASATPKPDDSNEKQSEAPKAKPFSFGQTSAVTGGFSFKISSTGSSANDNEKQSEAPKPFTFGQTTNASSVSAGFSFAPSSTSSAGNAVKLTSATSTPAAGFSFSQNSSEASSIFGKSTLSSSGSTIPSQGMFSFGKTSASQESSTAEGSQDADNEEYVPPQPEVKEIVEPDALYSKRCKLYYQKEGKWVDRGVGNFHLKPVADNKTQVLVRADTNLGNILLNIMLSASMPVSRQGKNNVFLVCVPNPPINTGEKEDTPIPMLIRVKAEEDADELLAKIDERKKLL